MKKFALTSLLSLTSLLVLSTSNITASFAANDKITICHRTDSVTNPYVQITVDPNAADGDTGNDNGQGDHAAEHQGPVPTNETEAQAFKDSNIMWGDIIPPHDNFPGLNWTAEGQAIYNNGCNYTSVTPTQTPSETPTESVTPTSEVTPTEEITPTEKPSPTPSTSSEPTPTAPACEGASCNTGGGGNIPTPSEKVTPTTEVISTPGQGGGPISTPTAPNAAEAPTATPTPGVGGAENIAGPTPSASSGPTAGQILGASAMAPTGTFEENIINALGVIGGLLMGIALLTKKEAKI